MQASIRHCCDLLKKLYLCGINYNIVGKVNELIAL